MMVSQLPGVRERCSHGSSTVGGFFRAWPHSLGRVPRPPRFVLLAVLLAGAVGLFAHLSCGLRVGHCRVTGLRVRWLAYLTLAAGILVSVAIGLALSGVHVRDDRVRPAVRF